MNYWLDDMPEIKRHWKLKKLLINYIKKKQRWYKITMKYCIYILSFFLIVMISGCACYRGYRDYEVSKPLKREGETLIAEKYYIMTSGESIIVKRVRRYKYIQFYRKYSVNERLYTNFNWYLLLAHITSYPLSLVFSPFALLGINDGVQERGNRYVYTRGRKFWNWINPFICAFDDGKYEYEITVTSHHDVSKTEYRDDTSIIDGAEISIILRDGRKLIRPAGVTISQLRRDIFEYPLPKRKEMVEITFKGVKIDLEISSPDLPEDQFDSWNRIKNASASEALANEEGYLRILESFLKNGVISKATFDFERTRLINLIAAERKRLEEEKAKRLQRAKDIYGRLVIAFDRISALSQKQVLTQAEYDELFKCAKILLDCEECGAIIAFLKQEKVISEEVAEDRLRCLQYARKSVATFWYRKVAERGQQGAVKEMESLDSWIRLREKGVFGIRFGTVFHEQRSRFGQFHRRSEGLAGRGSIELKGTGYPHNNGGFADSVLISVTPRSHKIYRITGTVRRDGARIFAKKLKEMLERKYDMTMRQFYLGDGFAYSNGEILITIVVSGLDEADVHITYTDLSLKRLAEQELELLVNEDISNINDSSL